MRQKIDPFAAILFLCWVVATIAFLVTGRGFANLVIVTILVAGFLGIIRILHVIKNK